MAYKNGSNRGKVETQRCYCKEQDRLCTIKDPKNCPTCRAEHTLDSVCSGASSSWTTEQIGAGRIR